MEKHMQSEAHGRCYDDDESALPSGARMPAEKSVKLFGVKLIDHNIYMGVMRKSVSMGNLGLMGFNAMQRHQESAHTQAESAALQAYGLESGDGIVAAVHGKSQQGYVSDGLMQTSSMSLRERKKGVPWTEDEHRMFLAGLQKLGKGDWRGISRAFVTSRTPTQVASHAQKYFLRQGNLNKRKRRSSLFDIINSTSMVPGVDIGREHPQIFTPTELNQPTLELGLRHVMTPSTSLMNSLPPYNKPPSIATPTIHADLCLGRSYAQEHQVSADDISSVPSRSRMQASSASSSKSSSSSHSSSSSLCRIDETSELSSLSLSIGPPMSMEVSELALKLEQPITSRHPTICTSGRVCEGKDVSRTPGAGTVGAGSANTVTSLANAIRVI
eukprot:c10465_g1_i1 orf=237-1391(-)